ncbi:hypothetical protein IFO70_10295 [Phormidium tenue FACHB-886]|nr:hypothetical protein [Phormidium tenue FACHB-886]
MSVDLKEFPQRIASVRSQLLIQQQNHRRLSDILNSLDRDIDLQIASSSDLKNELQRKAAKAELQIDEEYQAALMEVRNSSDRITALEIELERLRGLFSASKLEVRQAIVRAELEAA